MPNKKVAKRQSKIILFPLLLVMSLSFTGCDFARNQLKPDRDGSMETQDFRDGLAPRLPDVDSDEASAAEGEGGAIPGLQPYISQNKDPGKLMPLVSISVNQTVPLRDILFELAQQADYDLELDPRISGSIIFTARERPFDEVVERLCEVAGLRYKFDNDVLRVELDTPYNKTYKVDYLSYIRTNTGSIRNNVGVVSGDGADTGSTYEASAQSEADFWGELEVNLQQILNSAPGAVLRTRNDPRITATAQNPELAPVAATDANGNPIPAADGTVQIQPPQATLNVESLPVEGDTGGVADSSSSGSDPSTATFTLNKQAGLISVYASEHAQKEVAEYLQVLRHSSTAQVLIEAKILEVSLNDQHATGIDWSFLNLLKGDVGLNFLSDGFGLLSDNLAADPRVPPSGMSSLVKDSVLVAGISGNDVQAVMQMLSGFGSVRALASPRLTVLNNQSAVLNVANNRVFFEMDVDVTTEEGVTSVDIDSDIRNVPEGVLVNVQPSINLDKRTIAIALRPTITRVLSEKPDPAVQYVTAANDIDGVESLVPEMNVQEIDSVIQVRSGQAIVMGGLLQDRIESEQDGVPVAGDIPMVGALFRHHVDITQKTELVILLKATILDNPEDSIDDTDRDLYRTFSGDRRPLKL